MWISRTAYEIVFFLLKLLKYPVDFFCWMLSPKSKCALPPVDNELLLKSAKELSSLIRSRKVKCKDIIQAYVDRCTQVNPILNAIVQERFDEALLEAEKCDSYLESRNSSGLDDDLERVKPLFGVPITIKESIKVRGMSNRVGCLKIVPGTAEEDADIVKQVKEAGAIILCVTNTPLLCAWFESINPITGTTNNPYDHSRTSGGSSGGEATLISSAASVIGLGSDILGSLRIPALYTGIYGYKPSPFSLSNKGHNPYSSITEWFDNIFTLGPMTRYAEDLPLIMSVIKKSSTNLLFNEKVDLSKLKYYYVDNQDIGVKQSINSELVNVVNLFKKHIENKYNVEVIKPKMKYLKFATMCANSKVLSIEGAETVFSKHNEKLKWGPVLKGLLKKLCFLSDVPWFSFLMMIPNLSINTMIPKRDREHIEKKTNQFQEELYNLLQNDGVLISYACTDTAPRHNGSYGMLPGLFFSALSNIAEIPSIQCPLGFNSKNIPLGVHIATNKGNDRYLFALAKEIEDSFGGWKEPKCSNNMFYFTS